MAAFELEVIGSPIDQSANPAVAIAYKLELPDGADPSNVVVAVLDMSNGGADVTSTVMPANTPILEDGDIVLPLLRNLVKGRKYRVNVLFTSGISRYLAFLRVNAQA